MTEKPDIRPLLVFYAIAFGFAWAFWVPLALAENGYLSLPAGLWNYLNTSNPAAWGPLIGAAVVAMLVSGRAGLKDLLGRLTRVKFAPRWYLASLALIPGIVWLASWTAELRGAELPPSEALADPVTIPIAFIWIFFFAGPLQEEAGWRGVAAPWFQDRGVGALWASLVVGVLWGLWHLPLFYIPREEIYYNQPIWGLIGSTMLLSVLLTWVYNNTGKSLFAVMLMHTSFNWSNYVFTSLQHDLGGQMYFLLLLLTVIAVVIAFGPSRLVRDP